jgi:hypothetical protein
LYFLLWYTGAEVWSVRPNAHMMNCSSPRILLDVTAAMITDLLGSQPQMRHPVRFSHSCLSALYPYNFQLQLHVAVQMHHQVRWHLTKSFNFIWLVEDHNLKTPEIYSNSCKYGHDCIR